MRLRFRSGLKNRGKHRKNQSSLVGALLSLPKNLIRHIRMGAISCQKAIRPIVAAFFFKRKSSYFPFLCCLNISVLSHRRHWGGETESARGQNSWLETGHDGSECTRERENESWRWHTKFISRSSHPFLVQLGLNLFSKSPPSFERLRFGVSYRSRAPILFRPSATTKQLRRQSSFPKCS